MAGTRTVYRGSRGRFAGASRGKAERVRVGTRSISGTRATAGGARPKAQKSRVRAALDKRAAARQANNVKPLNPNVKPRSRPVPKNHGIVRAYKGSTTAGKVKFARNVTIGVGIGAGAGYLGAKAITAGLNAKRVPTFDPIYRNVGVGRREVVGMPNSPLRRDAIVGGRSVRSGAFVTSNRNPRTGEKSFGKLAREVSKAATASAGVRPGPNYSLAKGKKEYVGRRLKPGEGRGFKLATGPRR